jgi:N-acetylmuramic acid 6-phosphate (MurNAc-6-P) etherase
MSGVNSVNMQMYVALEMLKKSGQIQEQTAEKLLEQANKQIKFNIIEKLSGSGANQIDIKA